MFKTGVNDMGWSVEVIFTLDGETYYVTPPSRGWIETWGYNNSLSQVTSDGEVPPRHHSIVLSDLERAIRAVEGRVAYLLGLDRKPGGDLQARLEIRKWEPIEKRLRGLWVPPASPRPVRPYFEGACGTACAQFIHA